MSAGDNGRMHGFSEGGIVASHATLSELPVFVAPATAQGRNQVTSGLFPVGCWTISDLRFAFDSSVLTPEVAAEVAQLGILRERHKRTVPVDPTPGASAAELYPPLSMFGHADPVGDDEYNKTLSGRRVIAVYGLLTRKVELWEKLYSQPFGGDQWGGPAIDMMLDATGVSPDDQPARKQQAMGSAGPRAALFRAYMDQIASALILDPVSDFLARGADKGGKGDYQGCGEFNPLFLFSQEEETAFGEEQNKDDRNSENAPNRRVLVLLFRPGSRVTAAKWPCPRAAEGTAGCRKRFWSDGEDRRSRHLPDERREFTDTGDTFACRFYQRITSDSPCEAINSASDILVRLCDSAQQPIPNAACRVVSGGTLRADQADEDGYVAVAPDDEDVRPVIEWTHPEKANDTEFPFRRDVFLEMEEEDRDEAGRRRLTNLGYGLAGELKEMVLGFQQDFNRPKSGELADIETDLISWHDGGDRPGKKSAEKSDAPEGTPNNDPVAYDGPPIFPEDPDNPNSDGLT